jgi:uncharacterized membrane protein
MRAKVATIFCPFMDNPEATPTTYPIIVLLLTAVIAISASSLNEGEALLSITLLSLGLWRGLYFAVSWLAAIFPQ